MDFDFCNLFRGWGIQNAITYPGGLPQTNQRRNGENDEKIYKSNIGMLLGIILPLRLHSLF